MLKFNKNYKINKITKSVISIEDFNDWQKVIWKYLIINKTNKYQVLPDISIQKK